VTTCSTHVLDAALGVPAAGLEVFLSTADGDTLATARTDDDGRIRWDAPLEAGGLPADLAPATYLVTFATGSWFAAAARETFFPHVQVAAEISGPHVHVALLLSPFSYTTYKGS